MDFNCLAEKNVELFAGLCCAEINEMLECLGARHSDYEKGSYLLMEGDSLKYVGVVLEGQAAVFKTDSLGNRALLSPVLPSELFAEALVCAGIKVSPVTVEALTLVKALLIPFDRIMTRCPACCSHHNLLIRNMLRIVAYKAIAMSEKFDHVAHKTTRQKLASYLLSCAARKGSNRFTVDLDRQGMADYLCVNRSALSRELSRISEDGTVSYHRSSFFIRDPERLELILLGEVGGE